MNIVTPAQSQMLVLEAKHGSKNNEGNSPPSFSSFFAPRKSMYSFAPCLSGELASIFKTSQTRMKDDVFTVSRINFNKKKTKKKDKERSSGRNSLSGPERTLLDASIGDIRQRPVYYLNINLSQPSNTCTENGGLSNGRVRSMISSGAWSKQKRTNSVRL